MLNGSAKEASDWGRRYRCFLAAPRNREGAEALRRATEDGLIPSSMAVTFSMVGDA
jgi:hypothetical protein